jgi:hypothetical protein
MTRKGAAGALDKGGTGGGEFHHRNMLLWFSTLVPWVRPTGAEEGGGGRLKLAGVGAQLHCDVTS